MTKISAASLVAAATDAMQMPTGESGDLALNVGQIKANVLADSSITGKQSLVNAAVALVDEASMDLTAIKHTLTTSSAARTFTISYTGDDISMRVILNAASAVFTFPAASDCISEGVSQGTNTCSLVGVSGDAYNFSIKNWGGGIYTVISKNVS